MPAIFTYFFREQATHGTRQMSTEVTQLLDAMNSGDAAAAERLLPLIYEELRSIARSKMANEKPGHTLQATALVHEAWIKLLGGSQQSFSSRKAFFSATARAMQQILIDGARRKQTKKHGANRIDGDLDESLIAVAVPSYELIAVDEALSILETEDAEAAEVVRLRYFVGMTIPETATALGLAPRTINRHWTFARAWLKTRIRKTLSNP